MINLELYESTWVAMSVGLSILIGFVSFVLMMKQDKKNKKEGGEK